MRLRERIRTRLKPGGGPCRTARFSDYDLDGARPPAAPELTAAAVLVPIVEHPGGETVLLTRRTDHLHAHAGQVSFPGGRIEPGDASPEAAALRETREEIGLEAGYIEIAGRLDDYQTVTGFLVTPVVALVRPGFTLELDRFEVAEAFEVPLAFLLDPANHHVESRVRAGRRRRYYCFHYRDHRIWGATAGMLMNLYRRLR